jgi:hypothetical protein
LLLLDQRHQLDPLDPLLLEDHEDLLLLLDPLDPLLLEDHEDLLFQLDLATLLDL